MGPVLVVGFGCLVAIAGGAFLRWQDVPHFAFPVQVAMLGLEILADERSIQVVICTQGRPLARVIITLAVARHGRASTPRFFSRGGLEAYGL